MIITAILIAASASSPAPSGPVSLTAADAGKTIELKIGQTLQVSLAGNKTTGYNWVLAPMDPALLEQVGDPDYKPDSSKLGSPGVLTLKFKAATAGQAVLHLDYKRSWEKAAAPDRTFEVNVVVK